MNHVVSAVAHSSNVDLTLSSLVVSNGYPSKCSAPYWSNPPFLIFDIRALWRSGLSARVPECQKLKMVGETSTALNVLVDSFLPQSEKNVEMKGLTVFISVSYFAH